MSFPARIYPEQIELALVHSRDNVNDKSQTIVDLMGGNRVKNFDMSGMGSNATKDLGLLSVVASKDCFMLSGGKSTNQNNRNITQNMAGPIAAALMDATPMSSAPLSEVRLDLNLLRAVGTDIVTMPALMTEVQLIMGNPLAYPQDVVEKINTLLVDMGSLNNLMQLGLLPEGRTSIESLAKELSVRIAENSMALFDTAKISKDLFELVTNKVDQARAQFNITSEDMNYKMMAMEGRLNDENYLARAMDDLRQNLVLALQNPTITDAQRIEITKVLETLGAVADGSKNALNITVVLAGLSPSIIELLPENRQSALTNAIATTIDAAHVTSANQLGISIDQMRTIDTAMLAMAGAAQDLTQKLELLSPTEREILTQLQASVAAYQQSPLSLATIGEISKLQSIIGEQINGQNNVVSLESFKNISPEMMTAILKSAETVLPMTTSILADKWNMSPQEIHSIATTLMAAKDAYELELKGATNPNDIEAIQKTLNDIAQVQLNPFTPQSAAIISSLMQSPVMEKLAATQLSSAGITSTVSELAGERLSPLESLIRLNTAQAEVIGNADPANSPREFTNTPFRPENFGFYAPPVIGGGGNVVPFPAMAGDVPTINPAQPANDTNVNPEAKVITLPETPKGVEGTAPAEAKVTVAPEGGPTTPEKGTVVEGAPTPAQPTGGETPIAVVVPEKPAPDAPTTPADPVAPKPETPAENKAPKPEDGPKPAEDGPKPAEDKKPDIKPESEHDEQPGPCPKVCPPGCKCTQFNFEADPKEKAAEQKFVTEMMKHIDPAIAVESQTGALLRVLRTELSLNQQTAMQFFNDKLAEKGPSYFDKIMLETGDLKIAMNIVAQEHKLENFLKTNPSLNLTPQNLADTVINHSNLTKSEVLSKINTILAQTSTEELIARAKIAGSLENAIAVSVEEAKRVEAARDDTTTTKTKEAEDAISEQLKGHGKQGLSQQFCDRAKGDNKENYNNRSAGKDLREDYSHTPDRKKRDRTRNNTHEHNVK